MLIDAHNHLQDEWLEPHLAEIVAMLGGVGLSRAVVNGTQESDWPAVAALARKHAWVLPSYGLHPWFAASRTPEWREKLAALLAEAITQGQAAAVGEIGLDRWKKPFDFADQQEVFLSQLELAAERNLPATIHCLEAWGPLETLLRTHPLPARGFLVHAYGGSAEMAETLAGLGAYFSFSGYFLHERKTARREVFRRLPLDRLLVETDAPGMPLPEARNRFPLPPSPEGQPVNHPGNIQAIYEALAELRGLPVETLAAHVAANFSRLFGPGALTGRGA